MLEPGDARPRQIRVRGGVMVLAARARVCARVTGGNACIALDLATATANARRDESRTRLRVLGRCVRRVEPSRRASSRSRRRRSCISSRRLCRVGWVRRRHRLPFHLLETVGIQFQSIKKTECRDGWQGSTRECGSERDAISGQPNTCYGSRPGMGKREKKRARVLMNFALAFGCRTDE